MSVIDGEERPTNVNEVSDYATEIHTHLREMEVRKWIDWMWFTFWTELFWAMCYRICIIKVFACASRHAGQVKTKSRLHEETAWHHKQHACHPSGLVGGGGRGVQAAERDPLPGCKLHRSLSVFHVCPERETTAGGHSCYAFGFVSIFALKLQALNTHFSMLTSPCLTVGSLRRSTPQRWQNLFTSLTTPTQRNKCWEWSIWCWPFSRLILLLQQSISFSPSISCTSLWAAK